MPDIPDRPDFAKDGTVRLYIDGSVTRLRRPKTGEFRKLRELLHGTQDDVRAMADAAKSAITDQPDEVEGMTPEAAAELAMARIREVDRRLTVDIEDANLAWTREAAGMLGDKSLPEATDDWPTWLWSSEFIGKLFEHWRAVPLGPGDG